MSTLTFDPDNTLAGGLYALSPRESIQLGIGLCAAVEGSVGADGCHGGIWPGNITYADGQVSVGPVSHASITEMSPDALEFVSPEQFWSGDSSPASDVYSIGLVLYTALNGGVMPFFTADTQHTPEARAAALQNRMKGRTPAYPASACRELADVVLKAAAFRAEDRYATPGQLRAALMSLPEGAAVPAVAPVLPLSSREVQNVHSYKVDKDFEKTEPVRPQKAAKPRRVKKADGEVDENMDAREFRATPRRAGRWILPLILIVLIAVAAIMLLRGCQDYYDPAFPISTAPVATSPLEDRPAIHAPVSETLPPLDTPEPTPTPVSTEPPEPTYEIFVEDVTWKQAKALCEQKGGHLATVRSEEQLQEIIALAEAKGARYIWLGAYRDSSDSQWYYVTGEHLDYTVWDKNEPSARDNDGTPEDYLLLWYRSAAGTWTYNDMRNDPISVVPATYKGKTAYICQYDG